jgi:hypothetical protein
MSSAGMLMTSAGRTFAAMPRSTSQTSPRRGDVIQVLVTIELSEQAIGSRSGSELRPPLPACHVRQLTMVPIDLCPVPSSFPIGVGS